MNYLGEILSLGVAFSWTMAALSSEVASKKFGVVLTNVWRMLLAFGFTMLLMWISTGEALPVYADQKAWGLLLLSGFIGYFLGDWCLFNSYLTIGSRFGQLFMTLAPMFAAISAWVFIGQTLSWLNLLAMAVTMLGIAISILNKGEGNTVSLQLPIKGVLYGIGAGMGQGVGLVISKIGLDAYTANVPSAVLPHIEHYLPFSANMIRCLAGLVCYSLWLVASRQSHRMSEPLHFNKGTLALLVAVFSGPVIGVGFSLMAVQYTAAGIASTLMATTPIIILLPSHYLFHQKITFKVVIGAVISVIGVSLFFL
ncbi:MAG: DMT family transporter [Prevotella sp.]